MFIFAGLRLPFLCLLLACLPLAPAAAEDPAPPAEDETAPAASPGADETPPSLGEQLDGWLGAVNEELARVLFFDLSFGLLQAKGPDGEPAGPTVPFLVAFLAAGAIFFTFYHGFLNIRGFRHAVNIVRGKFSAEEDPGDIPPFRALTSALSATVGLGNIAGVAIAMVTGGPGALFWMMALGLFGMTAKFHESTLAQMFRGHHPDGTVAGGPMYYLDRGLRGFGPGFGACGKGLAIVFALFCMGASLGGGNMFQANQAFQGFYSQFIQPTDPALAEARRLAEEAPEALRPMLSAERLEKLAGRRSAYHGMDPEAIRQEVPPEIMPALVDLEAVATTLDPERLAREREAAGTLRRNVAFGFGLIISAVVAFVVIGGITRIGATTSRIVPAMCLIYIGGCLVVIGLNLAELPHLAGLVLREAFALQSAFGGLAGVMVIGFQRAAFSSEAGLGSSAIAHSAAKSHEPVQEGLVASLEPFIDTIVICFLTGTTVLITGAYTAPQTVGIGGAEVTLLAFQKTGPLAGWFPAVLSISIILFAFSTMISWAYYGEQAWGYLFGSGSVLVFRLAFVACAFIGTVATVGNVIGFADLMLLSMALPNILGGIMLAPLVRKRVKTYWAKYRAGEAGASPGSFEI